MRKVKKKNSINKLLNNIKKKETKEERKKSSIKKKSTDNSSKNKKRTNKDTKAPKKKKRNFWKKLVTAILILGIICVLLVTAFFGYIVATAPKFNEKAFDVQDQTVIYDINGEIIATLGAEKRESVSYDELPQVLIDAIIATEDSRFFQHNGVDLPRFIKASIYQVLGKSEAGGASTLTMQTVKNNLTSTESVGIKGIIRKFQDVYLSVFKVEKEYSKEEIIELYVNNYNLGSNIYGVGEASKYYFGKSVSELTLPEAAMIAGLFQAPNGHNPYKNMESAIARRDTVLYLMELHGYITKEEKELAKKITIESLLVGTEDDTEYQGYVDTVVAEVQELTKDNPYTVAMKIYTTMDRSIQDGINKILSNKEWYWKDDKVQAGIAIVNVETGAISAVGAGRNKTGISQFNYATQAHRQPGSTAKPVFDYGPGIEYNNFSSYTIFNDEPWTYTNGPSVGNWDGGYGGIMTMRYALQYSRNVPALKAFQLVGPKNVQKFAYGVGLDVSLNQSSENYRVFPSGLDNTLNEAYSIGGAAEGFTPLEMAAAYATFASGGYYTKPYTVTKIEYRETGETIEYKPTKTRVMKDSTAYIMNNILESAVTSGFNGGAYVWGSHVAAKTGTSNFDDATFKQHKLPYNAVNDLWTVAYTSQYSIAVWYGYENVTEGYNTSGSYKDALTAAVMKYIPKDTKGWTMPSSVVASKVEKETWPAKLPSEYTPSNMILTEYFVRGTQPTETSDRYEKLPEVENLKVTKDKNTATITWEYTTPKVLTEEYLKNYFSQSIFGKTSEDLVKARMSYNTKTLGDIGFGIYKEEADGTLTLINYTKELKYEYTAYGEQSIVVKAEHQTFKSNASSGTKVKIKFDDEVINKEKLIANLNGKTSINATVGKYEEPGIKEIYYGQIDVTKTATIKYQIKVNTEIKDFTKLEDFTKYVNTLKAGTYQVTYIISHLDEEITTSRTINLT